MLVRRAFLVVLLVLAVVVSPAWADPPKLRKVRTQTIGDTVFFHLRFDRPTDLAATTNTSRRPNPWQNPVLDPLRLPRLVPQDAGARAAYWRVRRSEFDVPFAAERLPDPNFPGAKGDNRAQEAAPVPANAIDFVGKLTPGTKKTTFLLLYPQARDAKAPAKGKQPLSLAELLAQQQPWAEQTVEIDFSRAKVVPTPAGGRVARSPKEEPGIDDLEGLWAATQAAHFALLEGTTPEFGVYTVAKESTARKYQLAGLRAGPRVAPPQRGLDVFDGRLYEITTGAAAITESLALDRLRGAGVKDRAEDRTVPSASLRGIDIAEHPWQKMMGTKRPAAEPLARLVPHDNYYLHFHNITKLLETGDLLDQWGTMLVRAFEVNSKDYRLKQRYEQQLCLKSSGLARVFGPAVVKGVAITGSDPYVREGSDLTVLFELANPALFKAAVAPYLAEARKRFGTQLKEQRSEHHQVAIESFVTARREVSLHRAFLGDVAIYSNSPAGVRRVIDTAQGRLKPLADALDFQYMRTIFRADGPHGDGFVFLSDAFIRSLVGPSVRIKERRRLEALTSLQLATNGALFTAIETGKLPLSHDHLLHVTGLRAEELFTPDGGGAYWDPTSKLAVSAIYNTAHFATPLIELPLDFVSPAEAREYEQFRQQYLGLWRQYFDPIGMRLALTKDEVRWETYILPLLRNTQYDELRRFTGEKTLKIDARVFSNKTLAQLIVRLAPEPILQEAGLNGLLTDLAVRSWLGDWLTVRLDDSPVLAQLLQDTIRREIDPLEPRNMTEIERMLQIPLTLGVEIRNPMVFAGILATLRKALDSALPGAVDWAPAEPYKGTPIVRIRSQPQAKGPRLIAGPNNGIPSFALYYVLLDGAFYLSLREEPIHDLIDRSLALKEKGDQARPKIEASAALQIAPASAVHAKDLLALYLEWEAHRRTQQNSRLLQVLFDCHVLTAADGGEAVEAAALHYLGYVPVSPDLAPFHYDAKHAEVVNQRHGSVRQPKLTAAAGAGAPVGQLLQQIATLRADLRFREDGIHTTVTLRKHGEK